jgi:hypothetical protein
MFQRVEGIVIIGVLAGAMGGFAASVLMGTPGIAQGPDQTTFQVARAQEFQLIDAKGRTRGRLAFSADAQPYLQLSDENDISGVWVGVARETGVAVRDTDGRTRLVLSVDETGNPSLVVRSREHQTRSFQP